MRDVSLTQHVLRALTGGLLLHLFAQVVEIGVERDLRSLAQHLGLKAEMR